MMYKAMKNMKHLHHIVFNSLVLVLIGFHGPTKHHEALSEERKKRVLEGLRVMKRVQAQSGID